MIKITSFRAAQHPEQTSKYLEGHQKVLEMYGVTKVTSADTSWVEKTDSIIIHVESDTGKTLGGGRIQIASETYPLPIEGAVGTLDSNIYSIIKSYKINKTGEFCGLWNSREIAGLGVGSIFLGRVGISLITRLNLSSLFALCSPATLKPCLNIGFRVLHEIGKNGTFYYPKEDLLATALLVPDPIHLGHADPNDRIRIISLRENPNQKAIESGPRGTVDIEYELNI